MRLVQHPVSLTWTDLVPTAGPQVLGGSSTLTGYAQAVLSPYGLVGFDVTYPVREAVAARALNGLVADLEGGANVLLFPYRDVAAEPDRGEFGLSAGPWPDLPWGNGLAWGNGQNWRSAPPGTVTLVAAALDASEVTLSLSPWPWAAAGLRGTVIGFVGHFGAYTVQSCRVAGAAAVCRIWPALRRAVPAGTIVTLRPVVGMRLASAEGGRFRDARRYRADLTLSLVEVPDDVVRRYAEPAAAPAWHASAGWIVDGVGPSAILDFQHQRYALPSGLAAADIASASAAALQRLAAVAFGDAVALTRASSTTATRIDEAGRVVADVATDAPRFDHHYRAFGADRSGRLLLEPARTNLVARSAQIDQWTSNVSPGAVTVTADAAAAPDGATAADKMVPEAASGQHFIYRSFSGSADTTYCYSAHFAASGYTVAALTLGNTGFASANKGARCNLATGTISAAIGSAPATGVLAAWGDFDRYWATGVSDSDGGAYVAALWPSLDTAMTGDGTSGVLAWGAQVEAGGYPTAYIPTTSASATRAIEDARETALVRALSGLTAWSLGLRFRPHDVVAGTIWQSDDGTTANRVTLSVAAGAVTLTVVAGGVTVYAATVANAITAGAEATVAFRIAVGNCALSVNGGAVPAPTTDTGGALPVTTGAALARDPTGTSYCAMRLARVLKYPAALSDAALKAMPL